MRLTDEASEHLERYLSELRASFAGSDVAELEQDIRDHIEAELGEHRSPISANDLDAVLTQLGSPREWVMAADPGSSRAVATPFGNSGEDWLAYTSIALLLMGFALQLLIPVSWLMARWALARLEQRGDDLGARRWLLYPPLALVSIGFLLLALLWPFGAFAELGTIAAQKVGAAGSNRFPPMIALAVAVGLLGAYWIVLGVMAAFSERAVRFLFHPFAGGFRRRHAWWLSGAGAILAALCAVAAFIGSR